MLQCRDICKKFDLSSVRFVYSGAAPLGQETIQELLELYPKWTVAQAYGEQLRQATDTAGSKLIFTT
jgi:hypothetical protein